MAAAYGFHVCKNHAFVDGNKRAATAAMIAFLSDNHWKFGASADVAEPVILRLASGEMSKEQLTTWLRTVIHEKPTMELREFFAKVGLDSIINAADLYHKDAGNTAVELDATVREASEAMPVIADVMTALATTMDTAAIAVLTHDLKTYLALYRIAEDMGYEW